MKLHPRLTADGVLLARRAERFRPLAERDDSGWVVGYGHRASAREGAAVTEDDATALLVYDLSRSAGLVEALVPAAVPPQLFDALNAYAFRAGPEAFAGSSLLRRLNAGEPVTPAEALAARDRGEGAPSAVLAAAQAVRDRLTQVLDAPEPAPPPRRARRAEEPPPEPPSFPPSPAPADPPAPPLFQRDETGWRDPASALPERGSDPRHDGGSPGAEALEPEPPPFILAEPALASSDEPPAAPTHELDGSDDPRPAHASFPPPVVSFERGGRARVWDRVRADPRVYMGVGACGLGLFVCALVGALLAKPSVPGFAVGLVGVMCLAPATAFFLQRRASRR